MKVVLTMSFAERLGGAERVLWTVLRGLDRSRVEPVAVFFGSGPFVEEVEALGVRTYVVPVGRFRQVGTGLAAVGRLARILRAEHPDLVLNFILKTQLYGAPAAVLAGLRRRVVWWQHDVPGRQWMDRVATLLPARAVIASSEAAAAAQARYRPRRRTLAVAPGVQTPPTASAAQLDELRASLGIPAGRTVVGIVGRLQRWKGQHRFLEAVALLRDAGHDVHALVVGGGQHGIEPEYEEEVRRRAGELGLEGAVTFTGQVPDAGRHLQLMDVSVNASEPEPFGLVLLESMAVGVPVVAVDAAGPAEILDGGRCGVLVPSGAPGDLARGVGRLLAHPELRSELAERGRERYAERYTEERMVAQLERRLRELAA
ncbi:MAG: glycosyltransferase [Thermoleophilaceae bacterium]